LVRGGKDWIFVSDAHLTGRAPEETEAFIRFLDHVQPGMGRLVILGDLFEFFFGFKRSRPKEGNSPDEDSFPFPHYLGVLKKIKALHEAGVQITYFEGNHDFSLHSFFQERFEMDVDVHPAGWDGTLGEKKVFMAHGDLSNPAQWNYRLLRRMVKNRATYALIQTVGPGISQRVANWMSGKSNQLYHATVPERPHPVFREFAHRKFQEGFDVVILGHSHFPEKADEEVGGRPCVYYNVGDWMLHRSYLRFTPPETFVLSRFEADG
jgi:UDP-2,3-diacylglucosamine hydrolase